MLRFSLVCACVNYRQSSTVIDSSQTRNQSRSKATIHIIGACNIFRPTYFGCAQHRHTNLVGDRRSYTSPRSRLPFLLFFHILHEVRVHRLDADSRAALNTHMHGSEVVRLRAVGCSVSLLVVVGRVSGTALATREIKMGRWNLAADAGLTRKPGCLVPVLCVEFVGWRLSCYSRCIGHPKGFKSTYNVYYTCHP